MLAQLSLGGRGKNRFWQLGALDEALWQLNATDSAVFLVLDQARACQVATCDALEWQHVQLLAHQRTT